MNIKSYPTWKEVNLDMATQEDIIDLMYRHELILNVGNLEIYFYAAPIKLKAQEYKFILHILRSNTILNKNNNEDSKNNGYIEATKLMKVIGSRCEEKYRQRYSYRIKSHIKSKIKKCFIGYCPPQEETEWCFMDSDNDKNPNNEQKLDFEKCFNLLMKVKDGRYSTRFVEYKKAKRDKIFVNI